MNLEDGRHDQPPRRRELARALADLLHEADVAAYRDKPNSALNGNAAYKAAGRLVDEFGVTHADVRTFLKACGDDLERTRAELDEVINRPAQPSPEGRSFRRR